MGWWRRERVLLLSGGSNRGAAQIGMVRSIMEAGWRPDRIVGASAGSLNAVSLGSDWSFEGLERLEQVWRGMIGTEVFPGSRLNRLVRLARGEGGLHSADGLSALIERHLTVTDLKECAIPTQVVVVDLTDGRILSVGEGRALPWLVASCSLPGVLPAVEIAGHLYTDGGATTPVPIGAALECRPRELIVCDVSDPHWRRRPHPGALETVLGAYQAARNEVHRGELARARREIRRLCWIATGSDRHIALDDFSQTEDLIAAGYRAAQVALAGPWRDHDAMAARLEQLSILDRSTGTLESKRLTRGGRR